MKKLANRNGEKRREFFFPFSAFPLYSSHSLLEIVEENCASLIFECAVQSFFQTILFSHIHFSPRTALYPLSWYNVWHFPFVIPSRRRGSCYFFSYQPPTQHPRLCVLKQFFCWSAKTFILFKLKRFSCNFLSSIFSQLYF